MAKEDKTQNQKRMVLALALTSLGITITALFENLKPVGIVMIGIGGFFMILSMKKKNEDNNDK